MRVIENELNNKTINPDKLLKYGFIQKNGIYLYKTKIYNEQFEMSVTVENNKMISKLLDLANGDEYILVDIKDSTGEFVGKVREEYEKELQKIIAECTTIDIIDLRYQKDKIKEIIDNDKIFAGYHMNKDSWITIKLDGSVKTEKIFELIDNSYNISLEKRN